MATLLCEVIGCGRPAAWENAHTAHSSQEECLCNACWARLRVSKPQNALCYVPCDKDTSPFVPASHGIPSDDDSEDVIYIGA